MKLFFESEFPTRGIDIENGVVKGATICTAGIEAKGHGLKTDDVLLRQLLVSARKKGAVPVGLDHKSGVKGTAGAATNFRILGNKLLADIQFFPTHSDFPLVMDQLSTLGNTMGISASFTGDADGDRARCNDLLGCDVVKWPAACPTGLFSALDENSDQTESTEDIPMEDMNNEVGELIHELLDHIEDLTAHVEQIEAENAALAEALGVHQDDDDEAGEEDEPVLEERGARGGPNTHDHASALRSHDFESRVEEFKLAGLDTKTAHVRALQEFARSRFATLNL
jgi:hypothetical protein